MTPPSQHRFLAALEGIEHGRLHLRTPEGHQYQFGSGGPEADIEIRDWAVLAGLTGRGKMGLGEAWIDGKWHGSSPEAVLALMLRNLDRLPAAGPLSRLRAHLAARVLRGATRQPHWGGNEFFQMWLGPSMACSGAFFGAHDDLEQAQLETHHRILDCLGNRSTLLELGCQWGAFTEVAAESGYRVTAEAANQSQKGYADARLDGRAVVRLRPAPMHERFDSIVAIETIETLPQRAWPAFFAKIKANLAPNGRVVLQTVTVPDSEFSLHRTRRDLLRQQIMSGGTLPCNAIIAHLAARAGLSLQTSHSFGADYARTCRQWRDRLLGNSDRLRQLGYDARFVRGWQFYLEGCAAAFATGLTDVAQIELTHIHGAAA
ncbi:cyclopropane-fatty-acyl-phospholipid synthase [Ketogulonicigenium robustum]|uniref:Cyclopropane-fatty-acyl-phospholipid synthase n=1 Tax=Ketogulonicigenium robustum TaxID=92947 RepID=A0A1W6NZN9_9RHOB|nr:class I SAM-dependent methyltransferase [Ketogulonicigenium robustum]ARO14674.1 cyclopropane-fatty-acyl-phospholipid synthase [Ketogulonicigenium robustum]